MDILTVFLDIDGVLRRTSAPKYKLESALVTNLERWVASRKEAVEIVISSTWKDAFSLDYIRALFPLALRVKIVGRTPTLTGPHITYPRYEEVMEYNRTHGVDKWIAFDDQPSLFPATRSLVAIDGAVGFQSH